MAKQPRQHKPITAKRAMLNVVRRLRQAGFEALLAGGCVRDVLLGKRPHDYDVATNAVPESVCRLFPRTLTVGAKFGVVIVLVGGRQVEVATFRSDVSYEDGRRPEKVVYTDARHDAQRRDFTINGMFIDPLTHEVIDYVAGREDLPKRIIRAIGNPDDRFAEDHLRMLRAVRFAARLGFEIEPATWQAMCRHAPKLARISPERIAAELEKILTDSGRFRGVQLALESGLTKIIFPEIPTAKLEAGLVVLTQLPRRTSFALALAALLAHVAPKDVGRICRYLRSSNELRQQTVWLVENHPKLLASIPLGKGPLKKWLAAPLFGPLTQLINGVLKAEGQSPAPLRKLRQQIKALGDEPISPPPLLDGHDLIKMGVPAGPVLGRLIEAIYLAQLENDIRTPSQASRWVRDWLKKNHT